MTRLLRANVGNIVYHVINRANARAHIFNTDKIMGTDPLFPDTSSGFSFDEIIEGFKCLTPRVKIIPYLLDDFTGGE